MSLELQCMILPIPLVNKRNKDAAILSFSLPNVNQKTPKVQILTEMYLMRSHLKKRSWQPLKLKGPSEFLIVPLSTQAWEIYMSSFSPLSMYMNTFIFPSIFNKDSHYLELLLDHSLAPLTELHLFPWFAYVPFPHIYGTTIFALVKHFYHYCFLLHCDKGKKLVSFSFLHNKKAILICNMQNDSQNVIVNEELSSYSMICQVALVLYGYR